MNRKNRPYYIWFITFLYTTAGTICLPGILSTTGENFWYTNSFFAVFFFAINLYMIKRIYPFFHNASKWNKWFAILFSFSLSVALHFGARLDTDGYITFINIWLWISILSFTLYFSVFIHAVWEHILDFAIRITEKNIVQATDKKESMINSNNNFVRIVKLINKILDKSILTWISLFALWIPTFLAFFPGAFVYDAQDEYVQVASRQFTTHHPLLHELLLGVPIRAAEHLGLHANVGITIYTLFQMMILSGVFAYALFLLKKWNVNYRYRGITLLIFGLFPVFPMYVVCSAKDTLFTACLFLVILSLLDYLREKEEWKDNKKRVVIFVAASIGMMLLRNNGIYAYLLLIPMLLLLGIKRWKKTVVLMLLSIFLFFLCSVTLKISLHASNEEHQEILTVPIQQLARTYQYAPDTFTEEEKQGLFEILSPEALNTYAPKVSDIIKSQFNNATYEANPRKYLSLWVKIGLRKPFIYVNAWFLTSYGYWYPDAILNSYGGIQRFTFQYHDSSYFGFETEPPGIRCSMLPALEEWYRNISLELFQQRIPVVSMLFSPGFLFWIFAFFWVYLLREKKREIFAVLSIIAFLWITVIFGPATLIRYMLVLWFIVPVLPSLLINRNEV